MVLSSKSNDNFGSLNFTELWYLVVKHQICINVPCFLFSLGKDLVTFCKCSEKIHPFWAIGKISESKRNGNELLID